MDISVVIIALGLLIFFSHTFNALFVKTRIPNVLLLMLIGLVIGPVLHLISPADLGQFGSVFTTITLIVILFESGTNLNPQTLKQSIGKATLLTILNFVCVMLITFLVGHFLLDLTVLHCLFLGAAVGGTSSAVVVSMLSQVKPGPKAEMILFLESALSDIVCLIVALAVLSGIQTGAISVGGMFKAMGIAMLASLLAGFVVGTIWLVVLKKWLSHIKNSMFTSFALAFIIYGACETIDWNGGLAVLAFGLTLSNIGSAKFMRRLFAIGEESGLNQEERHFYSEIVFVLQTYFFVYIGVSIQLGNVWHLVIGAVIVALIFALRPLTAKTMGRKDMDGRDHKLMAALGPKGLVGAVLASLPLQYAQQYATTHEVAGEPLQVAIAQSMTDHRPFHRRAPQVIADEDLLPSARIIDTDTLQLRAGDFARSAAEAVSTEAISVEADGVGTVPAGAVAVDAWGNGGQTGNATANQAGNAAADAVTPPAGEEEDPFQQAVVLAYNGQTVQNVAYAIVLFSIILCSVMVAVIESKYKKSVMAGAGPQGEPLPANAAAEAASEAPAEKPAEKPTEPAEKPAKPAEPTESPAEAPAEADSQARREEQWNDNKEDKEN